MGKRVLVLDDDQGVCATLDHILRRAGYQVSFALDVSKAFALAENQAFDLLISDLVMPEEDGVAVIRKFRGAFSAMPILAISGGIRLGTPETLAAARAAGADALLKKPFTVETLLAAVEKAMARSGR